MYLRRVAYETGYHYILRESYRHNGSWKYRNLADLGPDPTRYIGYPGGYAFYLTPEIEELLNSAGVEYTMEDLQEIFIPLLHPSVRVAFENSQSSYFPYTLSRACSLDDLPRHQEELHAFDVRRLYYLKTGQMDMSMIELSRSWRFLKILSCKCRDEIEAIFDAMEMELPRREINNYTYTALHLQNHFPHHMLRNYPMGLNLDEIDAHFLEEICRLNLDDHFFRGVERRDEYLLHPYLTKYVWLYFDHEFEEDNAWDWFIRSFMEGRQFRRPAAHSSTSISTKEAYMVFEITHEEFNAMSRKDLTRVYRRKAKKIHPDKGGDHATFVRLSEAYELLLSVKEG